MRYPAARRSIFTWDEISQIYQILLSREETRMTRSELASVYSQLHALGFYVSDFKESRAPFAAADFADAVEEGRVRLADDEQCAVCAHVLGEHEMFAAKKWLTRQEGFVDTAHGFCSDCDSCAAEPDDIVDFIENRGARFRSRDRDFDGMGIEDWSHGFIPAWDQPRQ